MNFQHFEALYWIGRLGSFHAAARHLGTSQPAVSARIRDFEIELGFAVFDRSQRKVRLTAEGDALFGYAAQLMKIDDDVRRIANDGKALAGRVRLGVTAISAMTWARVLIEKMRATHPSLQLELVVELSESLAEQIDEGQLDLAVLAGPLNSTKVATELLGHVPMHWLASPKLKLPEGRLGTAQLSEWPVITDRPGSYLHSAAMSWFRADGVEPHLNHACSSLPTRIHLAVQGLGIAFAAPSAASRELQQGTLVLISTERATPHIDYFLATPIFGLSFGARLVAETAKLLIAQKPSLEAYYSYYSSSDRLIEWTIDH